MKEIDPEARFLTIDAGNSLLSPTKGEFLPVESKAIGLDRLCICCHHWLYYAQNVQSVSDISRILDMLAKPLSDLSNRNYGTFRELQLYSKTYSWSEK